MDILITGNLGYVGTELVKYLHINFHNSYLHGIDTGYFINCITSCNINSSDIILSTQKYKDIRDINKEDLQGIDSVIHLSALSNDPIGNKFEEATKKINLEASKRIADLSVESGVKNLIFASSCSVYGAGNDRPRNEADIVNPLTAYANSKISFEQYLSQNKFKSMKITALRFATACGYSDRIRLDLVLNDFVASVITTGKINILSDGTPWRPLIDVEDMCRAIHWGLVRSADPQFLVVNVGSNDSNYQVIDLANSVKQELGGTVEVNSFATTDKRSYKVDFSLYNQLAKGFEIKTPLKKSINNIAKAVVLIGVERLTGIHENFIRLKTLQKWINAGLIDKDLRWLTKNQK
jgi:nucleoside-diphosphate-sugar epimerase